MQLYGRLKNIEGDRLEFQPDLKQNLDGADAVAASIKTILELVGIVAQAVDRDHNRQELFALGATRHDLDVGDVGRAREGVEIPCGSVHRGGGLLFVRGLGRRRDDRGQESEGRDERAAVGA